MKLKPVPFGRNTATASIPVSAKASFWKKSVSPRAREKAAALTPAYYNTYVGFGDSITWGKIEGLQHLELCYLTQMQTLLADPGYANYYGPSASSTWVFPATEPCRGPTRIDQDLPITTVSIFS